MTSVAKASFLANQEQELQQNAFPGDAAVLPPARAAQQVAGVAIPWSGTAASSSTSGDLQPQLWRALPVGGSREARSSSANTDESVPKKRMGWNWVNIPEQGTKPLPQGSAPAKTGSAPATAGAKRKREVTDNPFQ